MLEAVVQVRVRRRWVRRDQLFEEVEAPVVLPGFEDGHPVVVPGAEIVRLRGECLFELAERVGGVGRSLCIRGTSA
jgi:hypothetical protein